jgi:hypothetical protein
LNFNFAQFGFGISPSLLLESKKPVPSALQRISNTNYRRKQDVRVTRLYLLNGADVQINQLGQFLLSHFFGRAFPPDIGAKSFELNLFDFV